MFLLSRSKIPIYFKSKKLSIVPFIQDLTLNILFFGYGWVGYIIPDIGHQGSLSTREYRHLIDRHEHLIILTR